MEEISRESQNFQPGIIEETKAEPTKVGTETSLSDIALQKETSAVAGQLLLVKVQNIFNECLPKDLDYKVRQEIDDIFGEHLEKIQLKKEEAKAKTGNEKLGFFKFFAAWLSKKSFDRFVKKEVEKAIRESLMHAGSKQVPHTPILKKIIGEKAIENFSNRTFKKALSKEFSVLTYTVRSSVEQPKGHIFTEFKVKVGNSGYHITVEALRIQPREHLMQALDAKLKAIVNQLQPNEEYRDLALNLLKNLTVNELEKFPEEIPNHVFEDAPALKAWLMENKAHESPAASNQKGKEKVREGYSYAEAEKEREVAVSQEDIQEFLGQRFPDWKEDIAAILKEKEQLRALNADSWRTSGEAQKTPESRITENTKANFSVNAWIEKISVGTRSFFIARSGAFTDFSDTTTNIYKLEKELEGLVKNTNEYNEVLNKKNQRLKMISDEAFPILTENIQKTVLERMENRESVLSEYWGSFNPETIFLSQFSLLTDNGRELNMIKDIEWLFQQLDGKNVVFDGGSGFDFEGNLHMPQRIENLDGEPHKLLIDANFYNFKVQGALNLKNDANQNQYPINQKAWQRTEERCLKYSNWLLQQKKNFPQDEIMYEERKRELTKKWGECTILYRNNQSSYEISRALAELEGLMGTAIGINCKSGKDRTSYLTGDLKRYFVRNALLPEIKAESSKVEKVRKKIAKEIDRKVMKNDVGTHIAGMNIGVKVLKTKKIYWFGTNIIKRLGIALIASQAPS